MIVVAIIVGVIIAIVAVMWVVSIFDETLPEERAVESFTSDDAALWTSINAATTAASAASIAASIATTTIIINS